MQLLYVSIVVAFEVVHGFRPRLPIHAELETTPDPPQGIEPLEVASHLVTTTHKIFQDVRKAELKAYNTARALPR